MMVAVTMCRMMMMADIIECCGGALECYWLHHPCLAFGGLGNLILNFPKVDNSNK